MAKRETIREKLTKVLNGDREEINKVTTNSWSDGNYSKLTKTEGGLLQEVNQISEIISELREKSEMLNKRIQRLEEAIFGEYESR